MTLEFHALPSADVAQIRRAGRDSYGNPVETHVSDGGAYPCRHCLREIPAGRPYLVLAHRPFASDNPYAETGPIFLCADDCARADVGADVPAILRSAAYIVRGYGADERIVYGTGQVVPTPEIAAFAETLLARDEIAFVDVRSAANNCYQCRIRRVG